MKSVKKNTDFIEIMNDANNNFDNGNYEEALKNYEQALEIEPENARVIFRYGVARAMLANNLCDIDYLRAGLIKAMEILRNKNEDCQRIINDLIMEANKYVIDLVICDERFFYNPYVNYYQLNQFYINLQKVLDLLTLFEYNLIGAKKQDYLTLYNNNIYVCNSIKRERPYTDMYGRRFNYSLLNTYIYTQRLRIYQAKYSNAYYGNIY